MWFRGFGRSPFYPGGEMMDNKKNDLDIRDGLSDPSMEGVDLSGLTVDDILAEERGQTPQTPEREPAEPEYPSGYAEPEYPQEPEYAEPEYQPEPEYPPEPEYTEYAEDDEPELLTPRRRARRREERPEEEYGEYEEEVTSGGISLGISNGFLGLLALTVLDLLLLGTAVVPDLPDPAWTILTVAALIIACVPLLLFGLWGTGGGRIPAPFIMLAAVIIYAMTARLVEATIAASLFNVCYAIVQAYCERQLDILSDSLGRNEEPEDPRVTLRRMTCVKGVIGGQIEPMVSQRRRETVTLLGAIALALLFSLIPPLIDGMNFLKWIARGAVVLSLCAYYAQSASTVAYLNAVKSAFASGVCFAGADVLADAANATSVLFNKTGTITDGNYVVKAVDPVRISEEQLLYLASYAGAYSNHALMRAIRQYSGFEPDKSRILRHRIQQGFGSMAMMEGNQVVGVGNIDFMEKLGIRGNLYVSGDTCVFVSVGRTCVGRIDFADRLSDGAQSIANALRRERVANVALMTGDNALSATNIGKSVNISEIYSDCRPQEKAARLKYIMDTQERGDSLIVVSHAGEDSDLLEMADIGVTLGIGLEATDKFPDVVIPTGGLMAIPKLIRVAKKAGRSVLVNDLVYVAVRSLAAILALTGVLPMWAAVIVMSAVQIGTFMAADTAA